mgnify:CR=1 FL=1
MEKLYWGPTDVAAYANISKSKAYQFIQVMKDEYELDERRLLKGKVPVVIVKDFFDFKVEKRLNLAGTKLNRRHIIYLEPRIL